MRRRAPSGELKGYEQAMPFLRETPRVDCIADREPRADRPRFNARRAVRGGNKDRSHAERPLPSASTTERVPPLLALDRADAVSPGKLREGWRAAAEGSLRPIARPI